MGSTSTSPSRSRFQSTSSSTTRSKIAGTGSVLLERHLFVDGGGRRGHARHGTRPSGRLRRSHARPSILATSAPRTGAHARAAQDTPECVFCTSSAAPRAADRRGCKTRRAQRHSPLRPERARPFDRGGFYPLRMCVGGLHVILRASRRAGVHSRNRGRSLDSYCRRQIRPGSRIEPPVLEFQTKDRVWIRQLEKATHPRRRARAGAHRRRGVRYAKPRRPEIRDRDQ